MSTDAPPRTSADRAEIAELEALLTQVYALDEVAAGPTLATALAAIDEDRLPGLGLTYVMQARARQANHERGELLATVGRILHYPVAGAPSSLTGPDEFAADEVRAGLRLSRQGAKRLCELAWDLRRRLPTVLAAMRSGRLDQPRGQVFSTWTHGLSAEHTDAVLFELLGKAPELTTGELAAAIARLAIALDPEWVRRRYERALRGRRVVGKRNPDGTGTLTGHDLPADAVVAACAHLDALARAAKAAGHPDRLDHLRADLLLDLLTGRYEGMTDQQILAALLADAASRPATDPDPDGPATDDPQPDDEAEPEADEADAGDADPADDADDNADADAGDDEGAADGCDGSHVGGPATNTPVTDDAAAHAAGDGRGSGIGRRGGVRLSAGLLTVVGADQRPADVLGWGAVHAELAAELALRLRSWWCVLTDADGRPQAIVPVRRRPARPARAKPAATDPGEVWLHVDPDTRHLLNTLLAWFPPEWQPVLAEITTKLDTATTGPPNGDPTARLPGAQLRRWVHIRDGRCVFPGCRAPAHRADTDHTVEHGKGGPTVDTGLAAACRHDHRLRHEGGWRVAQDQPGQVTWTSRLGRTYQRERPPGLLDLPLPRHGAIDERDPEPPPEDPLPGWDPDSCFEEPEPPPPAPILTGEPAREGDEIPPF